MYICVIYIYIHIPRASLFHHRSLFKKLNAPAEPHHQRDISQGRPWMTNTATGETAKSKHPTKTPWLYIYRTYVYKNIYCISKKYKCI